MGIHTRITAALHIVIGVLGASMMLVFALGASWLGHFIAGPGGGDAAVVNFFFGFGAPSATALVAAPLTATLGATALAATALVAGGVRAGAGAAGAVTIVGC